MSFTNTFHLRILPIITGTRKKEVCKKKREGGKLTTLSIHFSPADQASNEISRPYDKISISLLRFIMYTNSVAVASTTIFDLPSKHSSLGTLKSFPNNSLHKAIL